MSNITDQKHPPSESFKFGALRRHPVATAILAILFFVVWTLPIGIAQAWPAFVRNKTIPEWLAEKRWPGMTAQIYGWLTIVFFLALVILLVVLIIIARRREASSKSAAKDLYSGKWLDTIVDYQRKGLRKYVLVEKCDINLSPLSQGKRYFEFTFHVTNYSMFNVSIPMAEYDVVKGSIHFNGDPISREAKLVENKVTGLQPYGRNYFKIWQWVSIDEAKDIPATLEKVGNLFDFSKAIVYVRADKFLDEEAAKLDLTRGMQNADLENKIIELGNANAQLRREITSWQERATYIEELTLALGACYQAYNQAERGESLSKEAFDNLKMRISHALSHSPNEPKMLFNFYDELPPIPASINEQKGWIDSQCFKLRELIKEQRQEEGQLIAHKEATQKQ
jgi:uncharacterized membrane protein